MGLWRTAFLAALEQGSVTAAAERASEDRRRFYQLHEDDPEANDGQ